MSYTGVPVSVKVDNIPELRHLAETPYEELGVEEVRRLAGLNPHALMVVIHHASELQPPNTEMMAAAGALALAQGQERGYHYSEVLVNSAAGMAFPGFAEQNVR